MLVETEKAGADFAVGGEAEAVALATERFTDGGNEADFALPFFAVLEPPAGSGGGGVFHSGGFKIEGGLEAFADFAAGDDVFTLPRTAGIEWHKFDEAHRERLLARELGERFDFVIVEVANDHGIDFDGCESQFPRSGDGGEYFTEAIAASEFFEIIAVERIEAEGHSAQAGGAQGFGVFIKMKSVGGEGEVIYAFQFGELEHELGHGAAQERLTAGEAKLGDAQVGSNAGNAGDFFVREKVGAWLPFVLNGLRCFGGVSRFSAIKIRCCFGLRKTIETPKIATIGYANAQVAHMAA